MFPDKENTQITGTITFDLKYPNPFDEFIGDNPTKFDYAKPVGLDLNGNFVYKLPDGSLAKCFITTSDNTKQESLAMSGYSSIPKPQSVGEIQTRYFECVTENHNKFWEITIEDNKVTSRWGAIGSAGQKLVKVEKDNWAAQLSVKKQINEKLSKGYKEGKWKESNIIGGPGSVTNTLSPDWGALDKAIEKKNAAVSGKFPQPQKKPKFEKLDTSYNRKIILD